MERISKLEHEVFFIKSLAVNWLKDVEPDISIPSKSKSSSYSRISRKSKSSSSSGSSAASHSSRKIVEEEVELTALKVRRTFAAEDGVTDQLQKLDEEIAILEVKIKNGLSESY